MNTLLERILINLYREIGIRFSFSFGCEIFHYYFRALLFFEFQVNLIKFNLF